MTKSLLAIFVLLSVTCVGYTQELEHDFLSINPFKNMQFIKAYNDTTTLSVVYTGQKGPVDGNNLGALKQIAKIHQINTRSFINALEFTLEGIVNKFYIPYNKSNQSVIDEAKPNSVLKLKCTVFRFFTIDGVCNFFYIDKILL